MTPAPSLLFTVAVASLLAGGHCGCPMASMRRMSGLSPHGAAADGRRAAETERAEVNAAPSPYPTWAPALPMTGNTTDPFVAMNAFFLDAYSNAGVAMRPSPIVVVENDYLVLFYNGDRVQEPLLTSVYHNLKMVSHVPLATFMMLLPTLSPTPNTTVELPPNVLSTLSTYLTSVNGAVADLNANPSRYQPGAQLRRQHDILNTMTSYISSLVATKATSLVEVGQVVHDLLPLLVLNINEASADQVDQLYATMEKWRAATIAPADWETLRVIVTASHMARRQSIVAQFFARYFNVDIIQSDKFITLESLSSEAAVFTLLDSHVIDYAIGDYFFHDHFRMHQDALCAGAKLALDILFPQSANSTIGCLPDNAFKGI